MNIEVSLKLKEKIQTTLDGKELESFARQIASGMVNIFGLQDFLIITFGRRILSISQRSSLVLRFPTERKVESLSASQVMSHGPMWPVLFNVGIYAVFVTLPLCEAK